MRDPPMRDIYFIFFCKQELNSIECKLPLMNKTLTYREASSSRRQQLQSQEISKKPPRVEANGKNSKEFMQATLKSHYLQICLKDRTKTEFRDGMRSVKQKKKSAAY